MATILIVDDSPLVRRAWRRTLERAGHSTLCAADGDEALRTAATSHVDVAVVDYQMPGMDGLTLLAKLRALCPHVPRLLVSGALELEVILDAVNRGEVSRAFHKPVDAAVLVDGVAEALAQREAAGQRWRRARDRARVERGHALRELLGSDRLVLGLQPIVRADDRRGVAFEALLRPRCDVLPNPGAVLAAAEEHGLVEALGAAVARRAAAWLERLPPPTQIFINLHPDELGDPDALLARMAPLERHARRVVLEVTERTSAASRAPWPEAIARLKERGFRIAVDDLGAGASALSALAEIDPDVIKLDMSLTRALHVHPRKQRLVDLICRFALTNGAEVVAEGIETAEELRAASELGVDLLQGFYLARPTTDEPRIRALAGASLPLGAEAPSSSRSGTRQRALRSPRDVEDLAAWRRGGSEVG